MMNRCFRIPTFLFFSIFAAVVFLNMGACPQNSTTPPGNENANGNANDNGGGNDNSNDNGGGNDNSNDNNAGNDNQSDGGGDELFAGISGNETLVEGVDYESGDGSVENRNERFTSTFTLTRVDAENCGQVFVGDVLADKTCGNLQGQAHLTYSESGSNVSPDLECPAEIYSGQVEWDVDLEGTYTILPSISPSGEVVYDSMTIDVSTATVSSPEYMVTFTYPGCPEFANSSASSYFWAGPGRGTFTLESIVILNGQYDGHFDNPSGNDLGDADFYDIHVETTSPNPNPRR